MLEYDNSAFYYFTLSLISIYLVPVTLVLLKQVGVVRVGVNYGGITAAQLLVERESSFDFT